jgi:phosphate starvation-inducible PhoH-like protein
MLGLFSLKAVTQNLKTKPPPAPASGPGVVLEPADIRRLAILCGQFNANLSQIERRLHVKIHQRGNVFTVSGQSQQVQVAELLLQKLYAETAGQQELSPETVHLHLQDAGVDGLIAESEQQTGDAAGSDSSINIRTRKGSIKARGANQVSYVKAIRAHDINFGIGPAGTGKTYLAVACAVEALQSDKVERILLVRPAVEAGEKLGFLPGDLAQKIDPYLRPLYDALYEMLGFEAVGKLLERQIIEIAPLAYMRGRTLNHAFIILDESQNTTTSQMKMFLTRIGFGSTVVITGDATQIDLPRGTRSGLLQANEILSDVEGISFTRFTSKDVVRHPLVQLIVDAYDRHEHDAD